MRNLRFALGLVAIACTFCVATSALAATFTASREPKPLSEAEPGKTKGVGIPSEGLETERNQRFHFGPFDILCTGTTKANTIAEGAVSWEESQTFSTEARYAKCLAKAHFGTFTAGLATKFNWNPETKKSEPMKIVYHVNGFAETGTGETVSEVELGTGDATFAISGKVCKIHWPAQTVPAQAIAKPEGTFSAAAYSNLFVPVEPTLANQKKFPSGFQQRLIIEQNFKNMEWHFEEGQCMGEGGFEEEAKAQEGKTGVYEGALEEQVIGGNLGFE
jgi:hypothetical protein